MTSDFECAGSFAHRRLVVMLKHYRPGELYGGPVRSIENLALGLRGKVAFDIITLDRDYGATECYPGIDKGCWVKRAEARVMYLDKVRLVPRTLRELSKSTQTVLYLNSFFDPLFSIVFLLLARFRLIRNIRIIVSPRGELNSGALAIKPTKKRLFLLVGRVLGLFRNVTFHATNALEGRQIVDCGVASPGRVVVIPNLNSEETNALGRVRNRQHWRAAGGELRVVLVGRVVPIKNVLFAIECVTALGAADLVFDIFGPEEDLEYARRCRAAAGDAPAPMQVCLKGALRASEVSNVLGQYDLFFLPTKGENHGHAIWEALAAGIPVLISDRTPFQDLEGFGAGWVVKEGDLRGFVRVLRTFLALDPVKMRWHGQRARQYYESYGQSSGLAEEFLRMVTEC